MGEFFPCFFFGVRPGEREATDRVGGAPASAIEGGLPTRNGPPRSRNDS
jgi:hypothetical protein